MAQFWIPSLCCRWRRPAPFACSGGPDEPGSRALSSGQRRITVIGTSRRVAAPQLAPLEAAGFELVERMDLDLVEDPEVLAAGIGDAWATIASGERYTREFFELAPSLRVIARMGIGF